MQAGWESTDPEPVESTALARDAGAGSGQGQGISIILPTFREAAPPDSERVCIVDPRGSLTSEPLGHNSHAALSFLEGDCQAPVARTIAVKHRPTPELSSGKGAHWSAKAGNTPRERPSRDAGLHDGAPNPF